MLYTDHAKSMMGIHPGRDMTAGGLLSTGIPEGDALVVFAIGWLFMGCPFKNNTRECSPFAQF
jgi:hypothetical protein